MGNLKKCILTGVVLIAAASIASSLVLDNTRENKVSIRVSGVDNNQAPEIYLLFSTNPMTNKDGSPLTEITAAELKKFAPGNNPDILAIRARYEKPDKNNWIEVYFAGSKDAGGQNKKAMSASSDEIWDNIAIAVAARSNVKIVDVVIRRGWNWLFDSRVRTSYANKKPLNLAIHDNSVSRGNSGYRVLNLSEPMNRFRMEYYEIQGDILRDAISDLAQTDGNKFSKVDKQWCSEFAAWIYRKNGLRTPNPYLEGVWVGSLRHYFSRYGKIYTFRQLASFSDRERLERIVPGSVICWGGHTYLFITWIRNETPMMRFAALSGNNYGMVYIHTIQTLPEEDSYRDKSEVELAELDKSNFFGVPELHDRVNYSTTHERTQYQTELTLPNLAGKNIVLYSAKNYLLLDVPQGKKDDGVPVILFRYNRGRNQQWKIEPVTASLHRIVNKNSGKTLTSTGNSVNQKRFTGESDQLWKIEKKTDGRFSIQNQKGLYLGINTKSLPVLARDAHAVENKWLVEILDMDSTLKKLSAQIVHVSSQDAEHPVENLLDGDPDSFWHTKWRPVRDPMPHEVIIDLRKEMRIQGITCLPRQDSANGRIGEYEIFAGAAKDRMWTLLHKGSMHNTNVEQKIIFEKPIQTRFLKILIKSEVQGNPFAAIAELDVVPAD